MIHEFEPYYVGILMLYIEKDLLFCHRGTVPSVGLAIVPLCLAVSSYVSNIA